MLRFLRNRGFRGNLHGFSVRLECLGMIAAKVIQLADSEPCQKSGVQVELVRPGSHLLQFFERGLKIAIPEEADCPGDI